MTRESEIIDDIYSWKRAEQQQPSANEWRVFGDFIALLILAQTYLMLAIMWFSSETITMYNTPYSERIPELLLFSAIAAAAVYLAVKKFMDVK